MGNGSTCRSTTVACGAFEHREKEGDVADGVFDVGVGWNDEEDSVPRTSRFAAARHRQRAYRGGRAADAPEGDCSPVSRRTPVSSDRNASDGALDIAKSADNGCVSRAALFLTRTG
mgnify:CR=1 FL=1